MFNVVRITSMLLLGLSTIYDICLPLWCINVYCFHICTENMAPKLKGYNIGETIGWGSCAKVKKCVHVATGETVAIKIISFKFPPINHGALERAKEKG